MTIPAASDYCWPVDTSCCTGFDDYDYDVQDRAISLATGALRSLTNYRVGGCPVTVRPCTTGCSNAYGFYGPAFVPLNWSGVWTNCGCSGGCIHNGIQLQGPVGEVTSIKIDGVTLDPTDYRIVDGTTLIRTDGERWPVTQDMTKADSEVGTWSITYLNAYPVDAAGAYAAGVLACQFAKACTTGKCDLPPSVTTLVRAGVTMTLTPGSFPNGLTGIREVDAYIRQWNPNGLRNPTVIWTPNENRPVTWQ